MDCPFQLFLVRNDFFLLFLNFFLIYFFKHFLLSFEKHLSWWKVELHLALFVHVFVNVLVDLVVEWAFLEVEVRVDHRSVDVNYVGCFFFFVKNVTFAVQLFLQEWVDEWKFVNFLPFFCNPCQILWPLVYVEFLNFYPSFLCRLWIRAFILLFAVFLFSVFRWAMLGLLFAYHLLFIQLSQSYQGHDLHIVTLFGQSQWYKFTGCQVLEDWEWFSVFKDL